MYRSFIRGELIILVFTFGAVLYFVLSYSKATQFDPDSFSQSGEETCYEI